MTRYKVTYTVYYKHDAIPEIKLNAYTSWEIVDEYFFSIRKAIKCMKSHPSSTLTTINN